MYENRFFVLALRVYIRKHNVCLSKEAVCRDTQRLPSHGGSITQCLPSNGGSISGNAMFTFQWRVYIRKRNVYFGMEVLCTETRCLSKQVGPLYENTMFIVAWMVYVRKHNV